MAAAPDTYRRVAAAALGVAGLVLPLFLWNHMADYRVYRRAAAAVLNGHDVYAMSPAHLLPFTYPPFAAAFVAPLGWTSAVLASVLLTVLNMACGLFVVWRVLPMQRIDAVHRAILPLLVIALMWTEPMRVTTRLGQLNVILMALVVADATGAWRRLPRGVLTGLAVGVKLTPGAFLLYAVRIGRIRAAAMAAGVFAGTVALGAAVQPSSALHYWTTLLWETNRVGDVASYGNQSLLGVSTRLVGPGSFAHLLWLTAGAAVLVVGLHVAARLHHDGNDVLALGVIGVVSTLISPISWSHHWVWCIPVFAGLLRASHPGGRAVLGWAAAWLAVFDVGPNTPVAHLAFGWPVTRALVGNDYAIAGLVLLAALALRSTDAAGPSRVATGTGTHAGSSFTSA